MKLSPETEELLAKHKDGLGMVAFFILAALFAYGMQSEWHFTQVGRWLIFLVPAATFAVLKFAWRQSIWLALAASFFALLIYFYGIGALLGLTKIIFSLHLPERLPSD